MADPRLSVIPAAAVTDRSLEGRDLQVLCLLGRHIDDNGWCRRSQVKMARELRCARSTVQASLGRLIIAGWVQQREEVRPSGGDTAHSYRVVLDREPPQPTGEPSDTPADRWAPLPTGRQGVPTHGSAPMLTTPLNEDERDARARDPARGEERSDRDAKSGEERSDRDGGSSDDIPDRPLLDRLIALHPQSAHDRLADIVAPWRKLSREQRRRAVDRFPAWLAARGKRQAIAGLPTYLGDLMFERIQAGPTPGESQFIPAFSRAWWWLFHREVMLAGAALRDRSSAESLNLRKRVSLAVDHAIGWQVVIPEKRHEAEEAGKALVALAKDCPAMAAWAERYRGLGVSLPIPDKAEWIFMPAEWPGDSPDDMARQADEAMAG